MQVGAHEGVAIDTAKLLRLVAVRDQAGPADVAGALATPPELKSRGLSQRAERSSVRGQWRRWNLRN
eukprot:CAMPEP_0115852678 /NCGR_PEP_ID=MMETSP0287-20121206/13119_1 /TAXON_ID=412157 /ORGANISM="Chrysochromulina rotalis, Strain UIO044" /LENGTH=66 /DNA_ID=CAMNT_0003306745 /DNA_START=432 /DNA_END=632 /DNA_ORIENTATION=+